MTCTVENQQQPYASRPDDIYDPDDVGFPLSPPLKPLKVNLRPSPSPPFMVPIPPSPIRIQSDSPPSATPRHKDTRRSKFTGSQSDAGLVGFMAGGMAPDVARQAGKEQLAAEPEDDEPTMNGSRHVELHMNAAMAWEGEGQAGEGEVARPAGNERDAEKGNGLALVAAQALRITPAAPMSPPPERPRIGGEAANKTRPGIPSMPQSRPAYLDGSRSPLSPEEAAQLDIQQPSIVGGLPPIRQPSSNPGLLNGGSGGPITLPSIADQLGDIKHHTPAAGESPFASSPSSRPPPFFTPGPSHGSPPKSPSDTFRRELPSPGRPGYYNYNAPRRPSQVDTAHYSSAEYSSAGGETPSTDQSGVTPGVDRMSIDGITNPQIGGYQCTYPGCTAQPFQTQYLLNSHANVHSSNRPHYCSVKGCARSEGGKGFKRKNEMIRHGLVHDSPGYVCPFCPDREHKYPRPDNLQRHVRVHHLDKNKDDPLLRDILAQRPEGPSKGRRRRGGNS